MTRVWQITALFLGLASAAVAQHAPPLSLWPVNGVTKVEFVFDNAVRQTNDLPTAHLRALRRQMLAGGSLRFVDLRALADAGDGLAAFRLARVMEDSTMPDTSGTKAHYYSIAAYTGRSFAVPSLAKLLVAEGAGYSAARLRHGLNAMTVQALSGNGTAATLLGQMYAEGVPFGRDLALAQQFLGMADGGGHPKAALQLGMALMADPANQAAAREALTLAASGADLSVRVTAENLLRLIAVTPNPEMTE